MKGIIYKATNKISKKIYIGQTIFSLNERIRKHYNQTKVNKNYHFLNALRFYEKEDWVWEIIEENIDKEKLDEREKYWVKYYDSFENGYNGNWGGQDSVKPSKIYELWHPEKGYIKGTALEISNKIQCARVILYQLYAGKIKTVKGYVPIDKKDNYKEYIKRNKKTIAKSKPEKKIGLSYKFYHNEEGEVILKIKEFSKMINYSDQRISDLIKGKCNNLRGWKYINDKLT